MSLTMKSVKGVLTLTWESPTMEASWKIPKDSPEETIIDTLDRVVRFVKMQRGEPIGPNWPLTTPALDIRPATTDSSSTAQQGSGAMSPGSPQSGNRIQMMPPTSLSDRPSDGGPTQDANAWQSLPTTTVPASLQGTWEIMPPEEMTW